MQISKSKLSLYNKKNLNNLIYTIIFIKIHVNFMFINIDLQFILKNYIETIQNNSFSITYNSHIKQKYLKNYFIKKLKINLYEINYFIILHYY